VIPKVKHHLRIRENRGRSEQVTVKSIDNCGKRPSGCPWDAGWSEQVMDAEEESGNFMRKKLNVCVWKYMWYCDKTTELMPLGCYCCC